MVCYDSRYSYSDVFVQENERFSLFVGFPNSVVSIYCCSAEQWHYDESFCFEILIFNSNDLNPSISTTATFSKKNPFCSIFMQSIPEVMYFKISLSGNYPYTRKDRYLGIRNSGSTCYMASILQILYHTTVFRQLIYSFKSPPPAPAALQNLFTELQLSSRAPSPDLFIRSLGSVHELSAVQQDAHEFLIGLLERLETDLGEQFIESEYHIFGGSTKLSIECPARNFKTAKIERFVALPVVVDGMSSLDESFSKMITTEKIADYHYNDETEPLEAFQTQSITRLPPILALHLCRFRYNPSTNSIIEIKSNFDCPFDLNMEKYCDECDDQEKNYQLYGIVAHSGNPLFGHYTSFVRPGLCEQWIQFNDGTTKLIDKENIHRLFGSSNQAQPSFFRTLSFTSAIAYMVFYVRNDCLDYINTSETIPLHLAPHRSSLYFSRFIFHEDLPQSPLSPDSNPIEWKSNNDSIMSLIIQLYPEKNLDGMAAWAQLPGRSQFIGPLNLQSPASQYVIKGHCTNFYILPESMNQGPIFIATDKPPKQIIDVCLPQKVSTIIPSNYCPKHQIYSLSRISMGLLLPGSIVIVCPIPTITLKIAGMRFTFPSSATYADVQKRISMQTGIPPLQIMFLGPSGPLKPKSYPYASLLPYSSQLSYQILESNITACSISLYNPLAIVFISHVYIQKLPKPLWVMKGTRCSEIIEMVPKIFADARCNEKLTINISKGSSSMAEMILTPNDEMVEAEYRIDMLRHKVPFTKQHIKSIIKNQESFCLEVRFTKNIILDSFSGVSRFITIHRTTTSRDIIKKIMRLSGSPSEQADSIILFISEKTKIKETISPDDSIYPVISKFINRMTKNNQRLCLALISEDPFIISPPTAMQRSLSGLLNQKNKL